MLDEAICNSVGEVVPLVVVDGDALEVAKSSTTVVSEPEQEKNPERYEAQLINLIGGAYYLYRDRQKGVAVS